LLVAGALTGVATRGQGIEVEHLLSVDVAPRRGGIIAINPGGTKVYKINASRLSGYHLSVWDARTGVLVREMVPESQIGGLRDIDPSPDGTEIYVTGMIRGYIHVFSSRDGRLLGEFRESGNANGQFNRALTSAIHDRTMFVSDDTPLNAEPGNMRIQKFQLSWLIMKLNE
jgi:DNA-binding beta-propeller fold protein YncE